ncbi:hypothetical protein D3C81_2095850 [compost metagenome]
MRGIDQTTVEHQIAGDIGVEIAVVVAAAGAERFTQCDEVLVGTAQRRQADGLDFEDVPGFPRLIQRAA